MLEAEVSNDRTILDYLNEDCWRAVLQYVPAQDLIRTERASRRWQALVLTYLQGVHIHIEKNDRNKKENPLNTCTLKPSEHKSFESWIKKLGASVASIYCVSLENLAMIIENCPNLGALQLYRIECTDSELRQYNLHDNFKFVQRVSFYRCSVGDTTFSQFIADKVLEKIEFRYCRYLTGLCFSSINTTNLKSLVLESCSNLQFLEHSVADHLGSLTELKVTRVNKEIGYDVQFELEKMANLERLELLCSNMIHGFPEKLGQLPRLEHLGLSFYLDDWDLKKMLQCCGALRSLELLDCEYSDGFVRVISEHGGALTAVKLDNFNAKDEDVLQLVSGCPKLELLSIGGATLFTPALAARALAALRAGRRLRLRLARTEPRDKRRKLQESLLCGQDEEMKTLKTEYKELIIVYDKMIHEYDEESEVEDSDEDSEWYSDEECEMECEEDEDEDE